MKRHSVGETRPRAWRRRAVTIPVAYLAAVVLVALLPLSLLVALVIDVVKRRRQFGTTRCVAFIAWYAVGEALFLLACGAQYLAAPGFTRAGSERLSRWTDGLGIRWGRWLNDGGRLFFDLDATVEGLDAFSGDRPVIMFLRHASLGDTVISPVFVGAQAGRRLRYVVKRELIYDPMFDLVGHRVGAVFVRRGSTQGGREIAAVCSLAESLTPADALVVYPEGTRFSAEKRERVLAKAAESLPPDLLERARGFRHVLPPRLGGPLALLAARPDADVVFCSHIGYEGAATWADLLHGRAIGRRVAISFRRVPADAIPRDAGEQARWLFAEWAQIDAWVAARSGELVADTAAVPVAS